MPRGVPVYGLYSLRKARNLHVKEVAGVAGITWQQYYAIEEGKSLPRVVTVARLARALHVWPSRLRTPPPSELA